jgi:hypothetical protein
MSCKLIYVLQITSKIDGVLCADSLCKTWTLALCNNKLHVFQFVFFIAWLTTHFRKFDFHVTVRRDMIPCIVTCDRASWHVTGDMWQCIVTCYRASWWTLIIKPTRCTNFPNLFWNETLHVSGSSSVHRQALFTVHSAMVYVIQVPSWSCSKAQSEKLLIMDGGFVRNL